MVEYSGLPGGSGSMFAFLQVKSKKKTSQLHGGGSYQKGALTAGNQVLKSHQTRKAYNSALEWVI